MRQWLDGHQSFAQTSWYCSSEHPLQWPQIVFPCNFNFSLPPIYIFNICWWLICWYLAIRLKESTTMETVLVEEKRKNFFIMKINKQQKYEKLSGNVDEMKTQSIHKTTKKKNNRTWRTPNWKIQIDLHSFIEQTE